MHLMTKELYQGMKVNLPPWVFSYKKKTGNGQAIGCSYGVSFFRFSAANLDGEEAKIWTHDLYNRDSQ